MIDFHSHILPGIDDGSKDATDSVEMLVSLFETGFDEVILSPHYYPDSQSIEAFSFDRAASFEKLKEQIAKSETDKIPDLKIGCEVYLDPMLFSHNENKFYELTLEKQGKIMLVEMEYTNELSAFTIDALNKLIYNIGITPVLAHIDRYPFMYDERTLTKLLDIGCCAQINVVSLNFPLKRHRLLKFLRKGYICAIGSDIHNISSIPEIKSGVEKLKGRDRYILSREAERMENTNGIQTFFG